MCKLSTSLPINHVSLRDADNKAQLLFYFLTAKTDPNQNTPTSLVCFVALFTPLYP